MLAQPRSRSSLTPVLLSCPPSSQSREEQVVEALASWVSDEFKDKRQEVVDTSDWPRRYETNIPAQRNGWDCGVFTLQARLTHPRG